MLRGKRAALVLAVLVSALPLSMTTAARATTSAAPCTWIHSTTGPALAGSDTNAYYWATFVHADPALTLTITGTYPAARYASIQGYTLLGGFLDGLVDKDFPADAGSNPFTGGGPRGQGTYTLHVVFGAKPTTPASGTLYLDEPTGTILTLMYRIYLPDAFKGQQGGVALPVVTASSGGSPVPCGAATSASTAARQRQALRAPADSVQMPKPAAATSSLAPTFTRFGPPALYGYTNHDAAYLTALLVPNAAAPLYVIRFKVPTTPHTLWTFGGPLDATTQLRYLSLCTYTVTDTPFKCYADEQLARDVTGQVTVVLGAQSAKPANATASGVTWIGLNWFLLPYLTILRNMLPADSYYDQSIFNVPYGGGPATMGPYAPTVTQCTKAQFEQDECVSVAPSTALRHAQSARHTRRP